MEWFLSFIEIPANRFECTLNVLRFPHSAECQHSMHSQHWLSIYLHSPIPAQTADSTSNMAYSHFKHIINCLLCLAHMPVSAHYTYNVYTDTARPNIHIYRQKWNNKPLLRYLHSHLLLLLYFYSADIFLLRQLAEAKIMANHNNNKHAQCSFIVIVIIILRHIEPNGCVCGFDIFIPINRFVWRNDLPWSMFAVRISFK